MIGTQLKIDWSQIDLEQFRRGLEVELEHGATSTGMLRAVDAALYRAKHEGRGRVAVAG